MSKILCKLGLHKWSGVQSHHDFSSNVIDYQKFCKRCGKVKKWNTPVR
jgi:hypothetical protein